MACRFTGSRARGSPAALRSILMPVQTRTQYFYGWRVVATCFVVAVFGWGFGFYGVGVYLAVLPAQHGWSASLVSAATTVYYLFGAVLIAFVPDALARLGPRRLFLCGMVAMTGGATLLATVVAPWQLFVAFLVLALGWAAMSMTAISTTLAPWFDRRRGLAISIALTGASVGGVVVAPLMLLVTERASFAAGIGVAVGLMAVILTPMVIAFAKRGPEMVGAQIDGGDANELPAGSTASGAADQRRALPDRMTMLRDGHFWTIAAPFALALTAQVGFLAHQVRMIEAVANATTAAIAVAATTAAAVSGRLVLGWVIDRHDPRWLAIFTFGSQAVALALMSGAPDRWTLLAASVLFGFSVGNLITLPALVIQREFTAASFGRVFGLSVAIGQFCYAFGPMLLGLVFDATGTYDRALVTCIAMEIIGIVLILAGRRVRHAAI